jgi:hypothetical protein
MAIGFTEELREVILDDLGAGRTAAKNGCSHQTVRRDRPG